MRLSYTASVDAGTQAMHEHRQRPLYCRSRTLSIRKYTAKLERLKGAAVQNKLHAAQNYQTSLTTLD